MDNSSTPSTSPLLRGLLSRPSTSSAPPPPLEPLPSTSSAPPLPPSTSSAPPIIVEDPPVIHLSSTAPTIEEEPPVLHLSDDDDTMWEVVPVSTAHPNYWDPELHNLVVEELLGTDQYRRRENLAPSLPEQEQQHPPLPSPRSSLGSPLPPLLSSSPLQPLPPSPPLSPSPPSSPLPQLPVRRIKFKRLKINTSYKVQTWRKIGRTLNCTIFNQEETIVYNINLPNTFHRPTRQQRHHHLFEGNLYLHVTKINGKFHFTFHP